MAKTRPQLQAQVENREVELDVLYELLDRLELSAVIDTADIRDELVEMLVERAASKDPRRPIFFHDEQTTV